MSNAVTSSSAESFADRAIPLLKEYGEKLAAMSAEARALPTPTPSMPPRDQQIRMIEHQDLRLKLQKIRPAAQSLARHVSQRVEHGSLEELEKLELTLRLAEFEYALLHAEKMLAAG
jgi:hypothetical protein